MTLHSVADRAARTAAPAPSRRGVRPIVLAAVCSAAVAVSVGAVVLNRDVTRDIPSVALQATPERLQALRLQPFFLFRSTRLDSDYGRVMLVPAGDPAGGRLRSSLSCARVDFAAGRGICLTRSLDAAGGDGVVVFDADLRTTYTLSLAGFPSRARVSPDGRHGAVTRFIRGDSYASRTSFSTRTDILDLTTGRVVLSLEDLHVTKGGRTIRSVDVNFWGVTFAADGDAFYATLGTGGHTYLIRGSLRARRAEVIADGVECPSLSPDGTRIAFKERDPHTSTWHLAVLDLATLERHRLATAGDVDDQPAWRGDDTVAYGLVDSGPGGGNPASMGISRLTAGGTVATSTWTVPADGSGQPTRELAGAWSAAVVRP